MKLFLDTSTNRYPSSEDQEHIEMAKQCVEDCHLESLITESKFLQIDSLAELVKVNLYHHRIKKYCFLSKTIFIDYIN